MITRTYPIVFSLQQTVFSDYEKSGLLFFDIETTGLAARSSALYLIGAVSYRHPDWILTQWFAQTPAEASLILQAFLDFASSFSHIIHFNGDRFDLPYLAEQCRACQLQNPLLSLISHDIYRLARPLKSLLGLSSLKQKQLEEYLGFQREDRFDGGQLICVYQEYAARPSEELLQILLLHNYEDLLGMLAILPLLSYLPLLNGDLRVKSGEVQENSLILRALLPYALPRALSYRAEHFYLSAQETSLAMQVKGIRASLKHFFADYKNYYYLPLEDTAIHKSVAAYVDKEYREPAKASTCYSKKEGFYLPQFTPLFQPVFQEAYASHPLYFSCTEAFLQDSKALQAYALHLLTHLEH